MTKTSFISKSIYKKHLIYAVILSAILFGSTLFIVGFTFANPGASSTFTISQGVYPGAPAYTLWKESSTYYAKNSFGAIKYYSTNASYVIQSCVNSFGVYGGSIVFRGEANDPFYITNSIVIPSGVASIIFKGDRQTEVLKLSNNADCDIFRLEGSVREISFVDIGLDGNKDNQGSTVHGIHFLTGTGASSNDCHIKRCIIVEFTGNPIYIEGNLSASEICENYIEDSGGSGIYGTGTANAKFNNNIIHGNIIWSNEGYGICLNGTANGYVVDNNIVGNLIANNELGGIYMERGQGDVIADNWISNNKIGMYLLNSHRLTVTGNSIKSTWQHGIDLHYVMYSTISSNTIFGASYKTNNTYTALIVTGWAGGFNSLYNIISANSISSIGISNQTKYGIFEDQAYADYNLYIGNICTGSGTVNIYKITTNSEIHDCFNGTSYIS